MTNTTTKDFFPTAFAISCEATCEEVSMNYTSKLVAGIGPAPPEPESGVLTTAKQSSPTALTIFYKRWDATDARRLLGNPNVGYQKSRFCTFSGLQIEVTPRYGNHHPISLFQRSLYLSGCKATTPLRIVFAYLKKVLENIQISQKKHHFHSILTHGTLFVENRIAQTKAL